MKLKQLTLQGYKTFPTKTEFIFDEGITAVVGPNGSGKSNIADALRWVLGEQSYSTLRGKRTVDMIFAGSQTRARSGMAQATLTLDNTEGWLPIDYSEVEIGRRAFRSGENEYILNGQKVRLRDIMELLARSGLSERTYTIIGQGLIDQALSLRADERRALFEEAAGINHYKARRAETLRRLNDTQHNLERVQDILAEIKPRLNSLKRQATRAKNFEQINQDLRHLLRIWYGYKWDQARKEMRLAKKSAEGAEQNWHDSRRKILKQQQRIDALQRDIMQGQKRNAGLLEQREDIRDRLEGARRQFAIQNERRDVIQKQLSEIESELPAIEEQKANAEKHLSEATADLNAAQKQLAESNLRSEQFQQSFSQKQREINEWQGKAEHSENQLNKIQTKLAQTQGQLSQIKERLQDKKEEIDQFNPNELEILENERKRQADLLSQASITLEEIRKNRQSLQNNSRKLISEMQKLRQELSKKQKELNQERERAARLETRADLLDQLRHKEIDLDGNVSLIGTLASLLTIPETHKIAIESALSERLSTLIVSDAPNLWKLLDQSKNQKISVAALNDVHSLRIDPPPIMKGVIGWASEQVFYKDKYKNIVQLLLGSILLVENNEVAYEVSRSLPNGTSAVSPDGFLVHAGGLVQSGNLSNGESALAREEAWKDTKAELAKSRQDYQTRASNIENLNEEIQKRQSKLESLQKQEHEFGLKENESVQHLSAIRRKVDQNEQQRTYLARQEEGRKQEINKLQNRHQEFQEQIEKDKAILGRLRKSLADAQEKLKSLPVAKGRQQQENLEQTINSAKTIVAGRLAVVDSRRTTLKQVESQINRLKQRHESYIRQLDQLSNDDLNQEQERLQIQQQKIDDEIEPIRIRLNTQREELFDLQNKTAHLQKHAHEVETVYTQTQVKLTQKQSQIEGLRERIHADLGLVALRLDEDQTGPVPLPITDVFDQLPNVEELPEDTEQTIQQYRGQLQRIGGINPDAPAEYEETLSRFEFMTQQIADLQQTEEQLRQVISELDELTSRAFAETVEKVDGIFGDTFTQLFGGGSARLILTDPDDLTVSGVDIIARLPNRREQGLGLLSGGERSLTASALIFSLLKVSPTPFCVLDEVDAALDEANINRFREILRELSLKTQIILITHNRGTVQVAQTIYGVSMLPDSASQVISIRPEEYIRQEYA